MLELMTQVLKGENEGCVRSFSAGCLISGSRIKILMKDGFIISPVGRLELTFMKLLSLNMPTQLSKNHVFLLLMFWKNMEKL